MTTTECATLARSVYRIGLAPQLTSAALASLRQALLADDQSIVQGLDVVQRYDSHGNSTQQPVAADPICWHCWWTQRLTTVNEIREVAGCVFRHVNERCVAELGVFAVRHFFDFWDGVPRREALATLAGWIAETLEERVEVVVA